MEWLTDYGSNASVPTISTTTATNDTSQPNGNDVSASWSVGSSLGDSSTTTQTFKLNGTVGEGGSLANTLFGLTTISTASGLNGTSLNLNSVNIAACRINEPGSINPQVGSTEYGGSAVSFSNDTEITMTASGGTVTFAQDGTTFHTQSATTSGTYYPFSTTYDTGKDGKFILVSGSGSSGGTRLPPPPAFVRI